MKSPNGAPLTMPFSRALSLRPGALDLERRGFATASPEVGRILESVVESFAAGYNHVLDPAARPGPAELPQALRGFAMEGAAMSATLLDLLTFSGGRRLATALHADGDRYQHLIHIGAGWAFARLHRRPWGQGNAGSQPVLRWLAWDGWGFHEAFFHPDRVFARHLVERRARGAMLPIRDQGAGRALWFYAGAEPAAIGATIAGFPPERRSDLWAGIGLAACYTGAQPADVLQELLRVAAGYDDHLGQGAAFAAKAHVLSGAVPVPSALAIEMLTGTEPASAADWTDRSLAAVINEPDSAESYQRWRALTRAAWTRKKGVHR
jgi:hypothetical protein